MNGGTVKGASRGGAGPLHHYDLPRVTLAAERQANASIYYVKTPLHYHYAAAAAAAMHGASDHTIAHCARARRTYVSEEGGRAPLNDGMFARCRTVAKTDWLGSFAHRSFRENRVTKG